MGEWVCDAFLNTRLSGDSSSVWLYVKEQRAADHKHALASSGPGTPAAALAPSRCHCGHQRTLTLYLVIHAADFTGLR